MTTRTFLAATASALLLVPASLSGQADNRISTAVSAAPASISGAATVMDWDQTVLRQGTNGWTCLPDLAPTPGFDPMCLDAPWLEWLRAYMSNTEPNISAIGIGYMLAGDAAASNTDPFATGPTPDNEWMSMGSAHIMLVVPDPAAVADIPTSPGRGGPWVMWRDTPFVHVMMPVAEPGQIIMAH